jgi:hypothetical protein
MRFSPKYIETHASWARGKLGACNTICAVPVVPAAECFHYADGADVGEMCGKVFRLAFCFERRAAAGAANTDDSPNHNRTTEVLSWLPSLSRDPIAGVAVSNSILPVFAARLTSPSISEQVGVDYERESIYSPIHPIAEERRGTDREDQTTARRRHSI